MYRFKKIRTLVLCAGLILFTACGGIESYDSGNSEDPAFIEQSSQDENLTKPTETGIENSEGTVTVLAKSNNTVSDNEKQAVLDELSNELDGLIKTINEIEADEIQESELNF